MEQKTITMTEKESKRYEVIKELIDAVIEDFVKLPEARPRGVISNSWELNSKQMFKVKMKTDFAKGKIR